MVLNTVVDAIHHSHAAKTAKMLGIRGVVKSVRESMKHTGRPDALLLHRNVITLIHGGATFDLSPRFAMGFRETHNASHNLMGNSKLYLSENASLSTRGNAVVGPESVVHVDGGRLSLGDCYLNADVRLLCEDSITIGDDVAIAWDVDILDTDFHEFKRGGVKQTRTAPIVIEDNAWIGHGVSIRKGVTIGVGAIVAADSTVTKDIPPNTLAAGMPAQVIDDNVERTT